MALKTVCSTPGAIFTIHIRPTSIEVNVALPDNFDLDETQAVQLERKLHNAVEMALESIFVRAEMKAVYQKTT